VVNNKVHRYICRMYILYTLFKCCKLSAVTHKEAYDMISLWVASVAST